jgi:hypothetical protein
MANRGRPKKRAFEDVPEEFKVLANSSDREELQSLISQVACNQVELLKLKAEDQDLASAKETARIAGQQYSDGTRVNRQKLEYCKILLDDKGGHTKG